MFENIKIISLIKYINTRFVYSVARTLIFAKAFRTGGKASKIRVRITSGKM